MRRPQLPCYQAVYAFIANWHDWGVKPIATTVRGELLTSMMPSPFWGMDMSLSFLPLIAQHATSNPSFARVRWVTLSWLISGSATSHRFPVRCFDNGHIDSREARAVVHFLKWLLRSSVRHSSIHVSWLALLLKTVVARKLSTCS